VNDSRESEKNLLLCACGAEREVARGQEKYTVSQFVPVEKYF
jgi:hypothetical protein